MCPPPIVANAPVLTSVDNAATLSQRTMPPIAQGSDTTGESTVATGIPLFDTVQKYLQAHNISLTKTQQKALEIGGAAAVGALGGYAVGKLTSGSGKKPKRSSSRSTRKRTIRRTRSVRSRSSRKAAHLVKGSMAAKRHMAKLRRMRG